MQQQGKWLLATVGTLTVVYVMVVLGFVASSPDLRLRCLLVDDETPNGLVIQSTPENLEGAPSNFHGAHPDPGDLLLEIGHQRIHSYLDFRGKLAELHGAAVPPGGVLGEGADPAELEYMGLPWFVEVEEGGHRNRWVRVVFKRPNPDTGQAGWLETEHVGWLRVQSVPVNEVLLTLTWLLLQLGIFAVGVLAFWNRPFDRPARLFLSMCIVTLGAFIGGFHWDILAGNLWLNMPFVVCAILVPAVTLHFFMVYPHPKMPLVRYPGWSLLILYAVPLLAVVGIGGNVLYAHWLNSAERVEAVLSSLELMRIEIYTYFGIAAFYFALTLIALINSFFTTRNPVERSQVKWILWAGLLATLPVSYSTYLALTDRVGFVLGSARIPMFLASLSFMLAYAVGIVRHKLMLIDQIVSKGMLYYVVSSGLTIVFSLTVAAGILAAQLLKISLIPQQALAVAAIVLLSIILLLWMRDQIQQLIDRRFFREKYQLDKALQRMNRAVGHFVDPESLAVMTLGSCREVLRVEHAGLYLRTSPRGSFQLISAQSEEQVPLQYEPNDAFLEALQQTGSLQRVTPDTRSEMSAAQSAMRELHGHLVQALEFEGGVIGLVVLGKKQGGNAFTAEDLTFLNAMGQITTVALHGAKINHEMTQLNEEVRHKVETISDQRRKIAMLQAELQSVQADQPQAVTPKQPEADFRRGAIKGNSPAIRQVLETVRKVAVSESSVIIRGESGTGKELLAHIIHDNSPRSAGPMIRVHCASLSPGLLESELFGHVKGAFTGAHRDKIGRFEAANGGTLFLDEIGDISLETQIKLLRVLQERCFEPVGSVRTINVDVRLVTATHQNLEQLIAAGRFREDLYYRLNVISITLPPLRERKEDLYELAFYFLNRTSKRLGKRIGQMDEETVAALERHPWPGNIRELENAIERAVVLAESDRISVNDLPAEIAGSVAAPVLVGAESAAEGFASAGTESLLSGETGNGLPTASEREILSEALQQSGGNKAQAARLLGMPRSTFFSKLKKHVID